MYQHNPCLDRIVAVRLSRRPEIQQRMRHRTAHRIRVRTSRLQPTQRGRRPMVEPISRTSHRAARIRPLSTPPSGQARPLTSTPTGLPDTRQPGRADTPSETPHAGTLSQIGILTVDQSGTGRLQQVVEGVQVADIVGQAIVIHAPVQPPQTAIPPNTNVSGVRKAAGDPNVPAQLPACRRLERRATRRSAACPREWSGQRLNAAGCSRHDSTAVRSPARN